MFKAALRLSALAPRSIIAVTTTLPVLLIVLCNAPLLVFFCSTARGRAHTYQLLHYVTVWTTQLVTGQAPTSSGSARGNGH
ncbi:hypothetical protein [Streptomyces sp. IB201691-2A2]|uniref:hypothetical protein n=1 Tax=Streptomyces sp. IB201691-2A2 TaxID=2561920 RepID=UPI00117C694F|nr:hypothetical protein [Streptomyces sp. IB201691-2A2]TRO55702.1 hypothetical protein E4K73_49675 [Streptomyces sp. IB201691-2A2]